MRTTILTAVLALAPAWGLAAPEILDGSDEGIDRPALQGLTMALVEKGVRDPNSAQYHSLQMNSQDAKPTHICGYVNLRNAFGAYVGFQAFQARLQDHHVTLLEAAPGDYAYALARLPFKWSGCDVLLDLPPGKDG